MFADNINIDGIIDNQVIETWATDTVILFKKHTTETFKETNLPKMGKDRGRGRGGRRNFQSKPYNKNNWRDQKREHAKHSNGGGNSQPRNK